MIRDKFVETIKKHQMINKGDRILVAVSGGPDSMAMCHLLLSIKKSYDLEIYGFHLDHMTRAGASTRDAKFVEAFFESVDIKSFIFKRDVKKIAKERGLSFEEAGREVRYGLLFKVLKEINGDKIALGQNLNDQGETLLYRLFRGSGLDGLTGIDYIRDDMIIRPILDLSRLEIEKYCSLNNLKTCTDHTNAQPIYARNRIRLEVLPYIKKHFNESIHETLWQTAGLLKEDQLLLDRVVKDYYNQYVTLENSKYVIDLKPFNQQLKALRSRLIRYIFDKIKGDCQGLTFQHIEDLLDLARKEATGKHFEIQGVVFYINYSEMQIFLKTNVVNEKRLGTIKCETIENVENVDFTTNGLDIYVDYDKIQGDIFLRYRKPGDRFKPLGMKGHKKIKDFFIDEKIDARKRDFIPLVCDDKNILWVVGYRMSDLYKVTQETTRILHIRYV